jgi:transcriptional regulator with XRE-family HTH domain
MTTALLNWRSERKFTQAEAGSLAGVSQATWAKWEGGQVPPEQCLNVHKVTGIALHVLRPDVYPIPQRRASDRRGIKA